MKSVIVIALFLILPLSSKAQIEVGSCLDTLIKNDFLVYADSGSRLSPENAEILLGQGKFTKTRNPSLVPGTRIYWIAFKLVNSTSTNKELVVNFQNWSYADAYITSTGTATHNRSGHLLPFKERSLPVANKVYIPVKIRGGDTALILVRLDGRPNLELTPKNLTFSISDAKYTARINNIVGKGIYACIAIFIISLIYNLFIYISTRMSFYLYYLLVIFSSMYVTLYNSGYLIELFQNVPGFIPALSYFPWIYSSSLYGIFVLLFVARFLQVKYKYPFWHKIIRVLIFAQIAACVVFHIHQNLSSAITGLSGILSVIVIMTVIIKSVKDKFSSAWFFLFGYSAFLISILVIMIMGTGMIPYNPYIMEFSIPVGSTIEITVFSFTLANMINILRRENELKQKEIILQLEEKESLLSKVQRELEIKVNERTKEINNQKIIIEKEKEKTESLLLNILPASVAGELKSQGYSTPKKFPEVAVLFTDFVGFTAIGKQMSAAELVNELDYCFKEMDRIIEKNDMEKIKTIGDAYMAVSGIPEASPDSATNAVRAALDILKFIENWNLKKEKEGKKTWNIRIGIHTGPVVAGVVGQKKYSFDLWGDTVNIASQMESKSTPGKVNISEAVYLRVKDTFSCEYRGKIPAIGYDVLDMYFVTQ